MKLSPESIRILSGVSYNKYMEQSDSNTLHRIGEYIHTIRERRGLTQGDLAKKMNTSQSAIARIESGQQNLTALQLEKIATALDHSIFRISDPVDNFQVTGGRKLSGVFPVYGSKNSAIALLCASAVHPGGTHISGIPRIEEVSRIIELLESFQIKIIRIDSNMVRVQPKWIKTYTVHSTQARFLSVVAILGSLLRAGVSVRWTVTDAKSLGLSIAHEVVLSSYGVSIQQKQNTFVFSRTHHEPNTVVLPMQSDTATQMAILFAAQSDGESILYGVSQSPAVRDVCTVLSSCGVVITGVDTSQIHITGGVISRRDITVSVSPDPVEAMIAMVAGIITGSYITVTNVPMNDLRFEIARMRDMGADIQIVTTQNSISVVRIKPSRLVAARGRIHALPVAGIAFDTLPYFIALAMVAEGITTIQDWMADDRVMQYVDLKKMGVRIVALDQHKITIQGGNVLHSTIWYCAPTFRPSVLALVCLLAVPGTSTLQNVYAIKRAHAGLVDRFNAMGAQIVEVK